MIVLYEKKELLRAQHNEGHTLEGGIKNKSTKEHSSVITLV